MRFSEKQLLVATAGLFLVVILGFSGFAYYLYSSRWDPAQTEITAVTAEIDMLKAKFAELAQLRIELQKLQEVEEQFKRILPTAAEVKYTQFVETMNRFANDAQVKLPTITRNPQINQPAIGPAQPFEQVSYTLTLDGGFYELARFIYFVETYERFIKVDNVTFTPKQRVEVSKEAKDLRTWVGATMVVSTYVFTAPVAPAGPPAAPGGGS
ncbi:MAG: type 4a pilus biogenesis protein PilO [Planctomycetes bacterium]|nr:type 4a pilus biogenesis protein PilO [Planctomycetota bacterium]